MEEEPHIVQNDNQQINDSNQTQKQTPNAIQKQESEQLPKPDLSFRNIIASNVSMSPVQSYRYDSNYGMTKIFKEGGYIYLGYNADYNTEVELEEYDPFVYWIYNNGNYSQHLSDAIRLFNPDDKIKSIYPLDTSVFFYNYENVLTSQEQNIIAVDKIKYHEIAVQRDFTFNKTTIPYKTVSVFGFDIMFPHDKKDKNPRYFDTLGILDKFETLNKIQTNFFLYLDYMLQNKLKGLNNKIPQDKTNPFYYLMMKIAGNDSDKTFVFSNKVVLDFVKFVVKSSIISYFKTGVFNPATKAGDIKNPKSSIYKLYNFKENIVLNYIEFPTRYYDSSNYSDRVQFVINLISSSLPGISFDAEEAMVLRILIYIFLVQNDLIRAFSGLINDVSTGKINDIDILKPHLESNYKRKRDEIDKLTRMLINIYTKALLIGKYTGFPVGKNISHDLLKMDIKPSYSFLIKYNGFFEGGLDRIYDSGDDNDDGYEVQRTLLSDNGGVFYNNVKYIRKYKKFAINDIKDKSIVFKVKRGIEIVLIRAHEVSYSMNPAPVTFDYVFIIAGRDCIRVRSKPDDRKSPYYLCEYLHGKDKNGKNGNDDTIVSTVRLQFKPEMNIDHSFIFSGDRERSKMLRGIFDTTFYIKVDHFTYQNIDVMNVRKIVENGEELFVIHPDESTFVYYNITTDHLPVLHNVKKMTENGEKLINRNDFKNLTDEEKNYIRSYAIEDNPVLAINTYKYKHSKLIKSGKKPKSYYDYEDLEEIAKKESNGDQAKFLQILYKLILEKTNIPSNSEYKNIVDYDIQSDPEPCIEEDESEEKMEEEPMIGNFELTGFNDFSSTEEDEEEVKEEDNTKKPKNKSKSKIVSKKEVLSKLDDEIKKD